MSWTGDRIVTDRLTLRAALEVDKPALAESLASPDVRRYLGGPLTQEVIAAFLASVVGETWGSFVVADRSTDECMGGVRLHDDRGELEISYELLPAHWGQGLASEAAAAALDWAWSATDSPSIILVTQRANTASVALAGRLGFTYEMDFEQYGDMQSQFRLEHPLGRSR